MRQRNLQLTENDHGINKSHIVVRAERSYNGRCKSTIRYTVVFGDSLVLEDLSTDEMLKLSRAIDHALSDLED